MPCVIFFTDLFKEAGFGHFVRSFALAEEFKKKKYRVFFISDNASVVIKKLLRKKKIVILKFKQFLNLTEINKIIIIDSYKTKKKIIDTIRKKNFLVIFNDFNKKITNSNIIINNNLGQKQKNKKDHNRAKHLIGERYFIIRKGLLKNKSFYSVKKKPKHCYVTFGGYNKEKKILNFFRNLKKTQYFINNQLNLYINTKLLPKKVIKIFKKFNNVNLKFVNLKLNADFNFNKMDMSINGGGLTSVEMIYLKIPQIVICLSTNQKNNAKFIKKNNLGFMVNKNIFKKNAKFDLFFNRFIKNYAKYKKNLIKRYYLDTYGGNRIVSEIIKTYKNEK